MGCIVNDKYYMVTLKSNVTTYNFKIICKHLNVKILKMHGNSGIVKLYNIKVLDPYIIYYYQLEYSNVYI